MSAIARCLDHLRCCIQRWRTELDLDFGELCVGLLGLLATGKDNTAFQRGVVAPGVLVVCARLSEGSAVLDKRAALRDSRSAVCQMRNRGSTVVQKRLPTEVIASAKSKLGHTMASSTAASAVSSAASPQAVITLISWRRKSARGQVPC